MRLRLRGVILSEEKRLLRSRSDRIIGGVCSGLAQYFTIDPWLVRVLFILLAFNGLGILVYMVMWVLVPDEASREFKGDDAVRSNLEDIEAQARRFGESISHSGRGSVVLGIILVGVGALFMLQRFVPGISPGVLWPIVLIAVGLFILLARR